MNDETKLDGRTWVLLSLNVLAGLLEGAAALVHVFAPAVFYPKLDVTPQFLSVAELFAVRNLVLTSALVYCTARRHLAFLSGLSLLMALIQLPDAAFGLAAGNPGQLVAPLLCASLHGACAFVLWRADVWPNSRRVDTLAR